MEKGPLAGLSVIDVGTVYAAPFAATLLGDLGADVTKIELPNTGDPLREAGPFRDDVSLTWLTVARNKKSVTLDMRKPKGKELFLQLVRDADILIENFRPGTMARWGLGANDMQEANPGLVIVRVSGYGQTGPMSHMAGFGTPAAAFSGYIHMSGSPDGPPMLPPISLADYISGIFAALGALAALQDRATGRVPREVDVALYESLFRLLEASVVDYSQNGHVQGPTGNELTAAAPAGVFRTADDEWVVLSTSTQKTYERFAQVTDMPEIRDDAKFRTNRGRIENRHELNHYVARWFRERTRVDALAACAESGVPACAVNDMAACFREPQVIDRDMVTTVHHPVLGDVQLAGVVPRIGNTQGAIRSSGPSLGAHTEEVLGRLGVTAEQLSELRSEGVV